MDQKGPGRTHSEGPSKISTMEISTLFLTLRFFGDIRRLMTDIWEIIKRKRMNVSLIWEIVPLPFMAVLKLFWDV